MNFDILFWLVNVLFWTSIMSFYSMEEMASISCNRIKLEFYAVEGKSWAIWLEEFLKNPTRLFTTTLIGVNIALMVSSESMRRLFETLDINPNFSCFIHIPFVLLLGELVPMFAARTYSEHVARLGMPFLWASSRLFYPVTACVEAFFKRLPKSTVTPQEEKSVTLDDLKVLLEEHRKGYSVESELELEEILKNILSLRTKSLNALLQPIDQVENISSNTSIKHLRDIFEKSDCEFIVLWHRTPQKILGVVTPKDLISATDNKKAREFMSRVVFVAHTTSCLELLRLLQDEECAYGMVLGPSGHVVGIVSLYTIFFHLFRTKEESVTFFLEKTIPADTNVVEFCKTYNLHVEIDPSETFVELIDNILMRTPCVGDTITFDDFVIVVKETTLFKVKTILIKST